MTASESIEDFKEVTEAEKTALEKSDAEWERPPHSFIDQCRMAYSSVVYNENTGFFELNGLTDISYAEMNDIWRFTSGPMPETKHAYYGCSIRTNLDPLFTSFSISLHGMFSYCKKLEVVVLPQPYSDGVHATNMRDAWLVCPKSREIKNVIIAPQIQTKYDGLYATFTGCSSLETVWLKKVYDSVNFEVSSNLRVECIKYLIENASNPKAMTLALHPDAYARVTDEIFALAAEKNITIASA